MPKIISANRLADGIVVYAGHGDAWVEQLNQAHIFASKQDADARLSLAQYDVTRNLIVEPFLVDVTQDANGLRPSTLRDSIRAQGPTIDFLPHRRAIAPEAIPPRQNFETHAANPVLREEHSGDLRAVGPKAWEAHSVAGLAEELAQ